MSRALVTAVYYEVKYVVDKLLTKDQTERVLNLYCVSEVKTVAFSTYITFKLDTSLTTKPEYWKVGGLTGVRNDIESIVNEKQEDNNG